MGQFPRSMAQVVQPFTPRQAPAQTSKGLLKSNTPDGAGAMPVATARRPDCEVGVGQPDRAQGVAPSLLRCVTQVPEVQAEAEKT